MDRERQALKAFIKNVLFKTHTMALLIHKTVSLTIYRNEWAVYRLQFNLTVLVIGGI